MDTFMDKLAQRLTAQEMIRANTAAETEELNQLRGQIGEYHECLKQMKAVNDQMSRLVNDKIAPEIYRLVEAGVLRMSDAQADTAGLSRLMEENREQLRKLSAESEAQMKRLSAESEAQLKKLSAENGAQLQRISEEGLAKLESAQVDTTGIQQLVEESRSHLQEAAAANRQQLESLSEEGSRKLQELSEESSRKLQELSEESTQKLQTLSEESHRKLEELQQNQPNLDEIKDGISAQLQESGENVHKECVKVYRNVQAIVVEESGKQTENVNESVKKLTGKLKAVFGISLGALVFSVLGLVAQILNLLHIFG